MNLFDYAETLKQDGMQRASNNAELREPTWNEQAFQAIIDYPGTQFMAEEVRAWAYKRGLTEPPNHRAWGSVIARAKRDGIIRHIGYRQVANPQAHKANASLWEKI